MCQAEQARERPYHTHGVIVPKEQQEARKREVEHER
jgi:hypothetical protein